MAECEAEYTILKFYHKTIDPRHHTDYLYVIGNRAFHTCLIFHLTVRIILKPSKIPEKYFGFIHTSFRIAFNSTHLWRMWNPLKKISTRKIGLSSVICRIRILSLVDCRKSCTFYSLPNPSSLGESGKLSTRRIKTLTAKGSTHWKKWTTPVSVSASGWKHKIGYWTTKYPGQNNVKIIRWSEFHN